MNPATWITGLKELSRRMRPAIGRPGFLLFGLVILAALPAFVKFEWSGEEENGRQATTSSSDSFQMTPRTEIGQDPTPNREGVDTLIEWDSEPIVGASDESDESDANEFDCMIEPWEEISVRSPVIGRIDAIHVERADLVEAGDLLVELDADLAKAELDVATKRTQMFASIKSFEARNSLGSKRSQRAARLYERNAIALDQKDEILTEKEISSYDLQDAHDQHSLANLQLARERARYEQRRIRSPVSGIVANRLMSVGEVTDEETVLEIAQIDPLRVEVILPAVEFGRIESGMKAAVIPEIPGDEVVVATVRLVDGIIDSASGTFGAELELPNPKHEIPGGLRCRVQFMPAATTPDVEPAELARAEQSDP